MKKTFIFVLTLVFFVSGCGILSKPEPTPTPTQIPEASGKNSELTEEQIEQLLALASDTPFTDFSGERLDGGTLDTKDFRGEVLVVNLMATWCGWCVYELPFFAKAIDYFEGKDGDVVHFIGIDVWEDFSNDTYKNDLKKLLEDAGIQMPILIDKDSSYANSLGIQGIPYTMIVDRDGVIRFVNPGAFMSAEDLIAMVDMVLYHSDRF